MTITNVNQSLNRLTVADLGQTRKTTTISITELRHAISGRVITPGEPDYDAAQAVFYGGIDKRPLAIVRVADAQDVSRTVTLARDNSVELAIRSGGHSVAGHSLSECGPVIDVRDMKSIDIDVANRTAWVQDDRGAYVGFLGDDGTDRIREAYPGPTWDRLVEIKRRPDPGNLFRLNQNVVP